jgi:hypothetical protein
MDVIIKFLPSLEDEQARKRGAMTMQFHYLGKDFGVSLM